jgi:pimeloyl-ACP methyl ester carboxylesterase
MIGPRPDQAPTLVMLHEGLGSIELWGDFPARLAAMADVGVFVYSRAGYGHSTGGKRPRGVRFMHEEAQDVLPQVLDAIGFKRGLLVGHSDGASIAAIYAGSIQDHRVRGLVLLAPHFFTEDMGVAEIARVRGLFETGDFRGKLARFHDDVDTAFYSWAEPWLLPEFRAWDITPELAHIRVPILIVQGADDQYGTARQLSVAQETCYCPVEIALLPATRHIPHRESPAAADAAIASFIRRLLVDHHEAAPLSPGGLAP